MLWMTEEKLKVYWKEKGFSFNTAEPVLILFTINTSKIMNYWKVKQKTRHQNWTLHSGPSNVLKITLKKHNVLFFPWIKKEESIN